MSCTKKKIYNLIFTAHKQTNKQIIIQKGPFLFFSPLHAEKGTPIAIVQKQNCETRVIFRDWALSHHYDFFEKSLLCRFRVILGSRTVSPSISFAIFTWHPSRDLTPS